MGRRLQPLLAESKEPLLPQSPARLRKRIRNHAQLASKDPQQRRAPVATRFFFAVPPTSKSDVGALRNVRCGSRTARTCSCCCCSLPRRVSLRWGFVLLLLGLVVLRRFRFLLLLL